MCVRKLHFALLCALISATPSSYAQDADDEEIFELSPFQVSGDYGYRTRRQPKPAPEITINDIGATIDGVSGIFDARLAHAFGASVAFAIGFYDDAESVRRDTLNRYINEVRDELSKYSNLRFEPGALLVPEGDRKRGRSGKRSAYTSYAHFDVSFEFGDAASPFEKVLEIREIVGKIGIRNDVTKLFYGGASLIEGMQRDTLLYGIGNRYKGFQQVDELGATVPAVTDELGRQLQMRDPNVAVTLVKRADAVRIEFALEVENASEAARASAIQSALAQAKSAVEAMPDLAFESGSILLSKGNGEQQHALPSSAYYAQALFSVRFELADGARHLEQVREIRQRLFALDWAEAELKFGVAALVVDKPDRYRSEVLQAVFADLKAMDEGMGELFEVVPKVANSRVLVRQASNTEVELWIPYDYQIVSVREREHQRDLFELELEKARAVNAANAANHRHPQAEG